MIEEVNNKTVLILAVLVILVVASTTWLVMNKVSSLEDSKVSGPQTIDVEYAPPTTQGAEVGLTIVPQPEGGEL